VKTCRSCGKELPGEFAFCPFCTAPVTEQASAPVEEERKIVSVLFCDLIGFTAASDAADPEEVLARIRPYHTRLRQEIERYGGMVEKFVGGAVTSPASWIGTAFGCSNAAASSLSRRNRHGSARREPTQG